MAEHVDDRADDAEQTDDEQRKGLGLGVFRAAPSWLVSLVAHVIMLTTMALLTIPLPPLSLPRIMYVDAADEPVALEEFVEVELPPAEQPMNAVDMADDPGMADLGEPETAMVEDAPNSISIEPDNIGAMFGTEGSGMANFGDGSGGAQFFGVYATGRRFVFIIDRSSSMTGLKFDVARRELLRTTNHLKPEQSFYVMFFDNGKLEMFGDDKEEGKMLPATPANLKRLAQWVTRVKVGKGTMPHDSVKRAMKLRPDAIYILSDGQFNKEDKTVVYLKETNKIDDPGTDKKGKVTIHTIGFHNRDDGTLERLAKDYDGTHRFVAKPPEPKKFGQKK